MPLQRARITPGKFGAASGSGPKIVSRGSPTAENMAVSVEPGETTLQRTP